MRSTILLILLAALALCGKAMAEGNDYRGEYNSPKLYAPDGTYLGNANNNRYDPNSIANPYGQYGNPHSPNSVNNRYGMYGSPYSNQYSNPNHGRYR